MEFPHVSHAGGLLTFLICCFVQFLSHVRLFVNPMDCSMPGFPVHHQLPEFAQTHVHRSYLSFKKAFVLYFKHALKNRELFSEPCVTIT